MLRITLRQLLMFRTLMETRSVTETANLIGVTQPAVSKTLAQVEAALGLELFERKRGRLRPLPNAERLHVEAGRLLRQVDVLNGVVEEMRSSIESRLSVAAIPILASTVIAAAAGRLLRTHADAQISTIAMSSDRIVDQVREHRVQLGFVHRTVDEEGIAGEIIARSEIVCVVRRDHPLARRKSISPQDLAGAPLVLLDALTPSTQIIRELFHRHGVNPTIAVETNMSDAAQAVAQAGGGIALIDPWAMPHGVHAELAKIRLRPRIETRVSCIWSVDLPRSRLAREFLAELEAGVALLSRTNPFIHPGKEAATSR